MISSNLENAVQKMKNLDENIKEKVNSILELTVSDKKLRKNLGKSLIYEVRGELNKEG